MPQAKPKTYEIDGKSFVIDHEMFDETEEEFFQKAVDAHEEYKRTGLHLTQEEVEEWMAKRARGERAPMPKLHT
ncbi:MAG: hypothetical protein ABIQ30_05825 [Devosia sp.]